MNVMRSFLFLTLVCAVPVSVFADEADKPPLVFKALKFRNIGPAIGGRVSRVCGIPGDPSVYYAATAGSGVWKSSDGGFTFKPVMDDMPVASIGSIAVAPSDPNVVYVGSGEANIRGNVAPGNGIYKSNDAGKTWQHVWKSIGQIGTIIVHPADPDIAFAAVLGNAFGPNVERGIYRTKDGGRTWQHVLFKDENTGASDVCFDPNNPRVLFAGLWQTRRRPWEMTSGGPGSGLYISRDGGDTWKQLGPSKTDEEAKKTGLPAGVWGKVGVAVAPSDSQRVYALIEAEKGGLFRSDDGGSTWKLANDDRVLRQRAWYYSTLTIDPENPNVIWAPQVPLLRSIDGGKSFQRVPGPHHGDHHDLWIDPKNPKRMIDANDGGVDISHNGGQTWFAPPLPIAQFYRIACDNSVPYRVAGCIQDIGSACGPSNSLSNNILLSHWHQVGGGEAGHVAFDPRDPNIAYAGEYGGYISRYDHRTRQARPISAYPYDASGHSGAALKYRFQWTAPILVSAHDGALYHAANVLFRSMDGGQTWQKISGDLTRNDRNKQQWSGGPITGDNTGVEVYCTIFAIAESPVKKGVLWAGSDDGLVHVSIDNGKTWTNVTANVPDMPDWGTVQCIEASRFDAGTAYVVVDNHRMADFGPHLWKTTDLGKSWQRLTTTLPTDDYLHVIREDPYQRGMLYLGSERGVYVSRNGGSTWQRLKLNLPASVPVHDMVVKDGDLVLGTMGRGIWILDDLTALRQTKPGTLYAPKPAIRWRYAGSLTVPHDRSGAENPPRGAAIYYHLTAKVQKLATLEIFDSNNQLVATFESKVEDKKADDTLPDGPALEKKKRPLPADIGLNRAVWDLTWDGADVIPGAKVDMGNPTAGPLVLPGRYTAKLTVDGKPQTTVVNVEPDPRLAQSVTDAADLQFPWKTLAPLRETTPDVVAKAYHEAFNKMAARELRLAEQRQALADQISFALQIRDDISRLVGIVKRVRLIQKQVAERATILADEPKAKPLLDDGKKLSAKLDALEEKLHNPKAKVTYDILAQRGGARLYSQLTSLFEFVKEGDGAPTQGMKELYAELAAELNQRDMEWQKLLTGEIAKYNALAKKLDLPGLWAPALPK